MDLPQKTVDMLFRFQNTFHNVGCKTDAFLVRYQKNLPLISVLTSVSCRYDIFWMLISKLRILIGLTISCECLLMCHVFN